MKIFFFWKYPTVLESKKKSSPVFQKSKKKKKRPWLFFKNGIPKKKKLPSLNIKPSDKILTQIYLISKLQQSKFQRQMGIGFFFWEGGIFSKEFFWKIILSGYRFFFWGGGNFLKGIPVENLVKGIILENCYVGGYSFLGGNLQKATPAKCEKN